MACNRCKRNKNKYGQTIVKRGAVPPATLSARQKACANCQHVSLTVDGKLVIKSLCKISNRLLVNALRDPRYKCPIDKFGQSK